jgi:hypothetical protein
VSREQKVGLQDWDCTCPEFPEHGPHEESCSRCGTVRPPLPATPPQPSAGEPTWPEGMRHATRAHYAHAIGVALDQKLGGEYVAAILRDALALSRPAQPATGGSKCKECGYPLDSHPVRLSQAETCTAAPAPAEITEEVREDLDALWGWLADESLPDEARVSRTLMRAVLSASPAASPAREGTRACAECGWDTTHSPQCPSLECAPITPVPGAAS